MLMIRYLQHIFPLVYLVLKYHLEILKRATTEALPRNELLNASNSLFYVTSAAGIRKDQLKGIWV